MHPFYTGCISNGSTKYQDVIQNRRFSICLNFVSPCPSAACSLDQWRRDKIPKCSDRKGIRKQRGLRKVAPSCANIEDRTGAFMFVVIWQFEILEDKVAPFEAAYGPEGSWA